MITPESGLNIKFKFRHIPGLLSIAFGKNSFGCGGDAAQQLQGTYTYA